MSRSTATRVRDEPHEFGRPPSDAPDRNQRAMPLPAGAPEPGTAGAGIRIVAWGEFLALAFLAIIGAFFASANASPGDYACGMILILASIALAFLRLKARFDASDAGAPDRDAADGWAGSLLVSDWANLTVVIVVFVVLALLGLFLAAGFEYGGLHNGGLALFVVSGAAIFLNLKHVFDIHDRRR
ncbi:MAG: hypothetical protein AB7H71_00320 [Alphaproteobacteria bacterium]